VEEKLSGRSNALLSLIERVMGKQLLSVSVQDEQGDELDEEDGELIAAE
jgi:hypothetical protein